MTSKLTLILMLLVVPLRAETPIVVELFTSEGCSSCPPAEELFGKLAAEPGVIALAFHVDYWNKLGWTDPFSNAEWSRRQGRWSAAFESAEVYTPQLIAGGLGHCVGSDEEKVRALMDQARKAPQPVKVQLKVGKPKDGKIKAESQFDASKDVKIALILFEDDLTTDVKAGENAGKQLSHQRVVRALIESATTEFTLDPAWKVEKLGVAAVVSDARMKVLGSALVRP